MTLTKFEQSGFILETQKGYRLAFDVGNKTPIEKLNNVKAVDAFLVSHIHGDHFSTPHIKALSPTNVYLNQECVGAAGELPMHITEVRADDHLSINEIEVTYFAVDHGPNISPQVENLGFLLVVDGQTIYFAGDMFYESGIDVTNLEVDYALLPVGTFYTFGPQEAFGFAKKFKHIGTIIPMHYEKTPETEDQFLQLAAGSFSTQ